jgi:hypothetical protein
LLVVNAEIAEVLRRRIVDDPLETGLWQTAQYCAYPCEQLAQAEWLYDVIIRANFEADDAIDRIRARGDHDDVGIREAAEPPTDLKTIHVRQGQVEYDNIGALLTDTPDGRKTIRSGSYGKTLTFKVCTDVVTQSLLRYSDKNSYR